MSKLCCHDSRNHDLQNRRCGVCHRPLFCYEDPAAPAVGVNRVLMFLSAILFLGLLVMHAMGQTVRTPDEFRQALATQPSEVILEDGIYEGQFNLRSNGSPGRPIIIRARNQWKAWLDPSGDYGDGLDLHVDVHDVIVDGIRVTGARTIGIRASNAERVRIINCLVEHCRVQGILLYGSGCEVSYNLIRRNGSTGQHHGLYISGDRHTVMGNVVDHNSGYGIHGYPRLDNSILSFNVAYGHDIKSGLLIDSGSGNFVLYNDSWNNGLKNVDIRSDGNRVLGNSEKQTSRWPLTTRPE